MKGDVSRLYYLVGQTPVPCDDVLEWASQMEDINGSIVAQTIVGDYVISTVFLGIDENTARLVFGVGEPHVFETMVFSESAWRRDREDAMGGNLERLDLALMAERRAEAEAGLDRELLGVMGRYSTWQDAERAHDGVVRRIEKQTGHKRSPIDTGGLNDNLGLASETKQDG